MSGVTRTKASILAAALLLSATLAHAGGRCFNAEIPQAMVLPDGSTHVPGTLQICMEQAISPASSLHSGAVDGRPVGMFLGNPRHIELAVEEGQAQFVFTENTANELVLIGYALSVGNQTTFFDMGRHASDRNASDYPIAKPSDGDVAVVLVTGR